MKIIGAFSLIFLLMMSGIAPILVNSLPNKVGSTSVENVSPLLVMFGDSEAEIAAMDQLLQNFPNSNVIDFSANKQQIIEYTGPVIYIGHSSEEGINYKNQLVQWSILSEIIGKSVSNNHYILGCNSQTISELTAQTGKNVVAFNFEIDAILGSLFLAINIINLFELPKNLFISLFFAIFMPTFSAIVPITSMQAALKGWILISDGIVAMYRLRTLLNSIFLDAPMTVITRDLLLFLGSVGKFVVYFVKTFLPWYRQAAVLGAASVDTASFGARVAMIAVSVLIYTAFLINEYIKFDANRWDYGDSPRY